ncbi:MAG: nucleoside deaminase [Candidatus Saccharimonadales bacterium]
MKDDKYFLQLATDEGNKNAVPYNFGAVIVKDGVIIAKDFNHVHENNDPSAHAEISALRKAATKLSDYNLNGAVMYGSHEPCLMCFSCAAWANITRVVYAIPASEQDDFSYEFKDVSLKDLASKLVARPISVELIPLIER